MSGYSHDYSMSNNALAAYHSGLRPASKIPGVPAALVRRFCSPSEWHHASKAYNKVQFYDPSEVRATFGLETHEDVEPNSEAVAALASWGATKAKIESYPNCHVEWIDWAGSLRHPSATQRKADNCQVVVKGQTATITLPNGRSFIKRLKTRGFWFTPTLAL